MYTIQNKTNTPWINYTTNIRNLTIAKVKALQLYNQGWNVRIINEGIFDVVAIYLHENKSKNPPTLIRVDLSNAYECNHPDIKEKTQYLALIRGRFYSGTFTKQWYGWNFNAVYNAGFQLSYPGFEALWEIVY